MLKIATLIAALVAASAFASNAEAAGMGVFYSSPFFRNQGRQPAQTPEEWNAHRNGVTFSKPRDRKFEALRAQRAAEEAEEAAEEAAATKRAHLLAMQKKAAAAKQAAAAAQARAEVRAEAQAAQAITASAAAPKGDLLPVASSTAPAAGSTVTPTKTADADRPAATTKTVAADAPEVCRKFSPVADALIEVPCK